MRYAYTGNVHDDEGDTTYCHRCGSAVIRRDWYELRSWELTGEGDCASCGTRCSGRFEGPPGRWGRKRLPVRLADFARRRADGPSR